MNALVRAKAALQIFRARGEISDEAARIRMLEADEIAGAGLDVFEHEPAVSDKLVASPRPAR